MTVETFIQTAMTRVTTNDETLDLKTKISHRPS
jgi:hypothetical protein